MISPKSIPPVRVAGADSGGDTGHTPTPKLLRSLTPDYFSANLETPYRRPSPTGGDLGQNTPPGFLDTGLKRPPLLHSDEVAIARGDGPVTGGDSGQNPPPKRLGRDTSGENGQLPPPKSLRRDGAHSGGDTGQTPPRKLFFKANARGQDTGGESAQLPPPKRLGRDTSGENGQLPPPKRLGRDT
ncbi:hypothetical protein DXG03_009488 [Asterophora parasitica]|uniref:Uncharacterized protein n=1 Tax=Asterophora parasitica TaxID=117018 RepID=A0A9P7K9W8_9AGAR|nr:hypothetical protein DXG03_009488 [Asterophora parasitica]